nr:glycosyltransferase [uncultured Pseudodesulfovibrio sp.]
MPTVSIVIPNYNYARFSDRLFGSIAAQSMPLENVEIIFVDDGSSDNSLDKAAHWGARIPCARFEIIALSRFGRPGPVRNHGLALAKGKYLFCMDPDDSLHPEYLARCVNTLEAAPHMDLVYTDYRENSLDGSREVRLPKFNQGLMRQQNILLSSALYKRELWDSGVRYRDNTEYEDWDYWIQCLIAGSRFVHIPELLYFYEIHNANFSHHARKNDGRAKAQIVFNNPSFFHPLVQEWATGFMRGRLHSQAFQRGYIPSPNDVRTLLKTVEQRVFEVSGF